MSRRFAYWLFASVVVLTAAPASADRECFENSCGMPDANEASGALAADPGDQLGESTPAVVPEKVEAEPKKPPTVVRVERPTVPPPVLEEPAQAAAPKVDHSTHADAEPVRAQPPVAVYPQMVVDPAPRKVMAPPLPRRVVEPAPAPERPAPRYSDDARPRAPVPPRYSEETRPVPPAPQRYSEEVRPSAPPQPRYPDEARPRPRPPAYQPAPVVARPVTPPEPPVAPVAVTRAAPAPVPAPVAVAPTAPPPAVVEYQVQPRPRAPQRVYTTAPGYVLSEGAAQAPAVVAAPVVYAGGHRQLRPDPSWKACQMAPREERAYLCGPHSYQPYGTYGYRPYGVYGGYRSAPVYVFAPDAKVISLNPED
jgi:hypothetical protein